LTVESIIRWLGGLLAYVVLGVILYGVWRGSQRQTGRTSGRTSVLRSPVFYFVMSAFFFGLAWLGWIPLPLSFSPHIRTAMLTLGCLLYFPGLLFVLWSRLELGRNYFVSSSLGAQLFADQQLVTSGPYNIVRHPMYVGLILAALGALLVYATWTTVYFAAFAPFLMMRARREEQVLAAEFGEKWAEYCRRVPALIPWLRR
jgi:protein-S-isoprenylcysteine O-methyltransferase Ste14